MPFLNQQTDVMSTLELDHVLAHVAAFCLSDVGIEKLEEQLFFTDAELLQHELDRVAECVSLFRFDDPFPLSAFADLRPAFKKAQVSGAFLDSKTLLLVLNFIRISAHVASFFENRPDQYPMLQKVVSGLGNLSHVALEIQAVIDQEGEVKDSASAKLKEIRRGIYRLESQVRRRLENLLSAMVQRGHAQEDQLTLRDGRLVIPVKESHRGQLKGIVVDQSASGATVFMEPLDVLEMNNEIRRLRYAERAEIERILIAVTHVVRESLDVLNLTFDILSALDVVCAKARFAIETDGVPAEINSEGKVTLKEARHPLLMIKHGGKEKVVPLSLEMLPPLKTLIITGPNAGGKTVALKTVGLCVLMHQFGLHIPAQKGSELPMFTRVFVDIGDQQSIEKDLSTFSSHIGKIKTILDSADNATLVLLDEIGSATDPEEGAALASAILTELTRRQTLTLATTHMGKLKVFAYETEGIQNASMTFDQKSLMPTYEFRAGVPGASYAFEIAERMGLSPDILKEASRYVGDQKGRLESFILELEESIHTAQTLQRENDIEKSRLEGLVKLYEIKVQDIQMREAEEKKKALEESQQILNETNVLVENLVREIRESQAAKDVVKNAKKALQEQQAKVTIRKPKKQTPPSARSPEKDDWVRWKGHSGRGKVASKPDSSNRVQVQFDHMKMNLPVAELELLDAPQKEKVKVTVSHHAPSSTVLDELDLRGLQVDEALPLVDKYLSDAVLTGLHQVRIIHGKGTGALRKAVGQHLAGHHLAKSQRLGHWNEGDTGVTVVELT